MQEAQRALTGRGRHGTHRKHSLARMGAPLPKRPVIPQPAAPANSWPETARPLAEQLQRQLAIGDRDWHALKRQRPRRAAEQLAAALVQLLSADDPGHSAPTPAREQAIALTEHALQWLRAEVSDPGCPSHGR
jgi:hypothetical protein